nr:hypothetical protein [uncultured Rhodopila sp.]
MTGVAPEGWPPGVTPIGIEDLEKLGLNGRNQLFWDGKRIEVRNRLDLTRIQKTFAVIVSVFAVLGAMGGFVTGLNNASIFLCARDIHWLSCPLQAGR